MFPDVCFDVIERRRKRTLKVLIFAQTFDDLKNGVNLRDAGTSAPLGRIRGIGPTGQVDNDCDYQQNIRKRKPLLTSLSFNSTHDFSNPSINKIIERDWLTASRAARVPDPVGRCHRRLSIPIRLTYRHSTRRSLFISLSLLLTPSFFLLLRPGCLQQ